MTDAQDTDCGNMRPRDTPLFLPVNLPMYRCFLRAALLCVPVLLAGCGGFSLWPFGTDGQQGREPGPPPNAITYACDAKRTFYVRMLEGGAAWVILPEREFRLDKAAGAAAEGRFTNGNAVLEIKGEEASLTDAPGPAYSGCRVPKSTPAGR